MTVLTGRRVVASAAALALAAGAGATALAHGGGGTPQPKGPEFTAVGTYATGITDGTSGETSAYDRGRLFVTNSTGNSLDVVDARDATAPTLIRRVDLSPWGAGPNSVSVHGDIVAVAVESDPKTDPGQVVFLRRDGTFIRAVRVGALPDMLTFTRDGRKVLVANEGEPSGYGVEGAADPEGSVSIIDVSRLSKGRVSVSTAGFRAFDAGRPRHRELPKGIRLNGPGASVSQDLEPEYVTLSKDGRTAFVTLQEANAIAEVSVKDAVVKRIRALGTTDHSLPGSGLDPSDEDGGIAIGTWPVRGLFMPDAVASFTIRGTEYLVTANEGDARDWDGFADEERIGDLTLDPTAFPDAAALQAEPALGRLNVSLTDGLGADGEHEALYSFGARSATIWTTGGTRMWDSGDGIEQHIAAADPEAFNANNEENGADDRSDNKGPEPEGVTVGTIRGRTYAFVGLERPGGFIVFDVTDPKRPALIQWANNRDYTADPVGPDSGPEVLQFVARGPGGKPTVIVSNEISGTVTFYEARRPLPSGGSTGAPRFAGSRSWSWIPPRASSQVHLASEPRSGWPARPSCTHTWHRCALVRTPRVAGRARSRHGWVVIRAPSPPRVGNPVPGAAGARRPSGWLPWSAG